MSKKKLENAVAKTLRDYNDWRKWWNQAKDPELKKNFKKKMDDADRKHVQAIKALEDFEKKNKK